MNPRTVLTVAVAALAGAIVALLLPGILRMTQKRRVTLPERKHALELAERRVTLLGELLAEAIVVGAPTEAITAALDRKTRIYRRAEDHYRDALKREQPAPGP